MKQSITWYKLWKRLGKQPTYKTQHNKVKIKIGGSFYDCGIVYDDNGSGFHLEPIENIQIERGMRVGDIVAACEYVGCDILTQLGEEIETTKENYSEVYDMSVEHLSVSDNRIQIWTFKDLDKLGENRE